MKQWVSATQREQNEIAEAIERYDEQAHSPFKWELYFTGDKN